MGVNGRSWSEETKSYLETWEEFDERTSADMFTITLAPYEQRRLIIETILPNADPGGIRSKLYVTTE